MNVNLKRLCELILLKLDDQLDNEQLKELDCLLANNREAQELYLNIIVVCSGLAQHTRTQEERPEDSPGTKGVYGKETSAEKVRKIQQYAERQLHTFMAEQLALRKQQETVKNRHHFEIDLKKVIQKIEAGILFARRFVIGVAALIAVTLAILVMRDHVQSQRIVASLGGTVDAQWAQAIDVNALRPGWLNLEKGYAQIRFIRGARILAEGPCALRLDGPNRLFLDSGSISAQVPPEAVGFTVTTPSSYVKDFGTEFGVAVDASQATELQVFKGEVGIRCQHNSKRSMKRLKQDQTALAKITGVLNIGHINSSSKHFVRRLPEKKLFINLADVVGGGNGLGTGQLNSGINPLTGTPATFDESYMELVQKSPTFVPVPWNAFVDGVFIPNRSDDPPLPISQTGLKFNTWPITRNTCSMAIINGAKFGYDPKGPRFESIHQGSLKNQVLGTTAHPTIRMQSNAGITFDLQAIRAANPQWRIGRFRAYCGISMGIDAKAAFWVLADGHSVFQQTLTGASMSADIDIALEENVRFLTLATTDADGITFQDWCMFAEPVLELMPKDRMPKDSENTEE